MANTDSGIKEIFNCFDLICYKAEIPKHPNNLTILHVNIRSTIKNFWKVEQILNKSQSHIDVLVLTEVNISSVIQSLFNIPGYTLITELRKNRKGGGIMLYVKNKHKFTQYKTPTLNFECIAGKFTANSYSLFLCAVYRPPNTNKKLFVQELDITLNRFTCSDCVVLGDINVNLKTETPINKAYLDVMYGHGLSCGITDFTRIEELQNKTTKTCIDHIFVRSRMRDVYCAALGTVLADHRLTTVTLVGYSTIQAAPSYVTRYDNSKLNIELEKIDWQPTKYNSSPNSIYKYI